MPVKADPETVPAGEVGSSPPGDYCPGRTSWVEDREDVFYVAPELRADYCRPDAPPSSAEMRKLWSGAIQINRVLEEGKGYRWAPALRNTGNLAVLRPTSPDVITVDPADNLHVAAWTHALRRNWAEKQVRVAEDAERREAALPRCQVCAALLTPSPPVYRPWSKGGGRLCAACSEAVNLAGAMRHLDEHRDAIAGWLDSRSG
jgi:hypothetical protein